jgi:glc operon protein GlcG
MKTTLLLLVILGCALRAAAQTSDLPYGAPIPLERARQVVAGARAEAQKNKWPVAIAVVDAGGHLVAFERMDTTQTGSVLVAIEKAKTSAAFRRPTKAFQDVIAAGGDGLRMLALPGATPLEGGLLLVQEGRIVGAIGISGVTSAQDAQIARAGVAALP